MNNFASFSEDALPRSIPLPSVDPRTLSLKANTAVPSVPELSILNYEPPVPQSLSAPKPTSYSAWKNQQMNGRIDSQPQSKKDQPAQRKTVSFGTPLVNTADLPTFNGNTGMINERNGHPNMCGQLELSEYEQPRSEPQMHPEPIACSSSSAPIQECVGSNGNYSPNVPISQIQQLRQEIVDRVNKGLVPSAVIQNEKPVHDQCSKSVDPPNSSAPDMLPILLELIRMLGGKINAENQINLIDKESANQHNPPPEVPVVNRVLPPPKENRIEASEPSVKDLHQLILKQQDEISLLREQVNSLMLIQKNAQTPATIDDPSHMHQPQPSPTSPEEELALGEEASTFPNQHQTPQPQQFHRRHHNSPADWKFYGNTLEQVAQILQNAPPSRSSPPQPNNHQQVEKLIQVHLQGMHFSDVNLSATQRVTFAPSTNPMNSETPKQIQRPLRNGSLPPALSDRSIAMNTLALKYLPEHHQSSNTGHGTAGSYPAGSRTSPAGIENKAPERRSKSPEMSAMTLDYLHKYGLLGNKRLFDE